MTGPLCVAHGGCIAAQLRVYARLEPGRGCYRVSAVDMVVKVDSQAAGGARHEAAGKQETNRPVEQTRHWPEQRVEKTTVAGGENIRGERHD